MTEKKKLKLSYSKISTFLLCRKKYWWQYDQNLAPKIKSRPLAIGDLVHTLRESWVKGELDYQTIANLKEFAMERFPDNQPDEVAEIAHQAAILFNGYVSQFESAPDGFTLTSPEMHLEKEFEDFILYARLDGLVTDANNDIWRDELKTASRMDSYYLQGYRKGLQTSIAHWLMDEVFDFKTRGTLFEIIVKTKIPQYARLPVIFDKWRVQHAKETVKGVVRSINRGDFYPSSQCEQYGGNCEFEPLCRNDTPQRRETFYTHYYIPGTTNHYKGSGPKDLKGASK